MAPILNKSDENGFPTNLIPKVNGSTMEALRFHGPKDLRYETIECPKISKPDELELAPIWCGVCGSDLHEYLDGPVLIPPHNHPHPLTHETYPLTLGHEFAGIVTNVGSDVASIANIHVGDKICVEAVISCNKCYACKSGFPNCCSERGFTGLSGGGGGLSQRVVIPVSQAIKLPPGIDLRLGALVEPLSVAYHAVDLSGIKEGETALVLGAGPIGIAMIFALQIKKVKSIIVSEPAKGRRLQAAAAGDHGPPESKVYPLDPNDKENGGDSLNYIVNKTREICGDGGAGAHVAFDCSGIKPTFFTALKAVRSRGTIFNVAIWSRPVDFNPNDLLDQEKKFTGSIGYNRSDFEAVIKGIEDGIINPTPMITGEILAKNVVNDGFNQLIEHKEENIKILCTTSQEILDAFPVPLPGTKLRAN